MNVIKYGETRNVKCEVTLQQSEIRIPKYEILKRLQLPFLQLYDKIFQAVLAADVNTF